MRRTIKLWEVFVIRFEEELERHRLGRLPSGIVELAVDARRSSGAMHLVDWDRSKTGSLGLRQYGRSRRDCEGAGQEKNGGFFHDRKSFFFKVTLWNYPSRATLSHWKHNYYTPGWLLPPRYRPEPPLRPAAPISSREMV
jgi:hypothetical protein